MTFLKKRETPVQNIAYIAIMAAVNVVFVLISSLLPILFVLLVFVLPLTSVIVTLYCKKYYLPIYAIVTLALCFGVSAGFSIFDTFIYVFPSIVTGILFGLLIDKKVPAIFILVVTTFVQYLLTSLTFLLIDRLIIQVGFFDSIYNMIGLADFQYKLVLTNIFTYIIAQIQIAITYILVKYEINRLGLNINLNSQYRLSIYISILCIGIITLLSLFFFKDFSILLTLLALPFAVYLFLDMMFKKDIKIYACLGVATLIFIFLFAWFYSYVSKPNHLVILYAYFIAITIIDTLFNYCFKPKKECIE